MPLLKQHTAAPVVGIFEASVYTSVQLLRSNSHDEDEGEQEQQKQEQQKQEQQQQQKGEKKGKSSRGKYFGIVSTGDAWRGILGDAVRGEELLGRERAGACFKGVEACGLDAGELHGHGEVERRVKDAVGRLVGKEGDVGVVVLGCAGMVGMEAWVREVVGEGVKVVDGVRAGVGVLQGLIRGGF